MRSHSWLFLLFICTVAFIGCSPEEDDTLDQVARILEEKTPFYWEEEGFQREFIARSGKGKAIVDVNRVEISELMSRGQMDIYLRNAVRIELYGQSNEKIWTLTANEGLVLPEWNFRFQKGVLLDLGDGFQLEAEELEINRAAKRFTSGPGFSLFTQVRLSEENSSQYTVLEGDSIAATYSFDQWEIDAPRGSVVDPNTEIAN